ncbi:protein of unknown function [Algoriphagus alkaliphilus]|uniref:TolB-like 6-blade propeller-like n=1 Tax=Algoriphagus alkaliphilus TaxID=279824 RepID=A0A1G5ZM11_9BACT|nr:DUF4221 family protein [Algoriphagus alkaliphilus]SDA95878.1 protein of unknown function [Algoriphagus alkaliphilus]
MKNHSLILALAFFSACAGKPDSQETTQVEELKNVLENIAFTVDTVIIDSGDSIIDTKNVDGYVKKFYSSVSEDGMLLYIFDRRRLILQEIDLNSLKLVHRYPFEMEGPDGVSRFVLTFGILPSGDFLVKDIFGNAALFSKTGKKLKSIKLNGEDLLQNTSLEPFAIGNDLFVDLKSEKLYTVPRNYMTKEIFFAVMDSAGQTGEIFEIPEFHRVFKFGVEYNSGGGGSSQGEELKLQKPSNLVLLSSTYGNAIYVFDPELDSLYYKAFPHEIAPLEKDIEIKNQVSSEGEFKAEIEKLHTQIDYGEFYWDKVTQRYYRFASIGLPRAALDSPKRYEFFMFAYDKNLELKGETKLQGVAEIPESGFFKDGKLWSYVNVEDDLGFAVFTFNF